MLGQPNFVVPPPINRQTAFYNPATVWGSLIDTVTELSGGYGVGGGVCGLPGVYGTRTGFY
jgi:hypothetical protein